MTLKAPPVVSVSSAVSGDYTDTAGGYFIEHATSVAIHAGGGAAYEGEALLRRLTETFYEVGKETAETHLSRVDTTEICTKDNVTSLVFKGRSIPKGLESGLNLSPEDYDVAASIAEALRVRMQLKVMEWSAGHVVEVVKEEGMERALLIYDKVAGEAIPVGIGSIAMFVFGVYAGGGIASAAKAAHIVEGFSKAAQATTPEELKALNLEHGSEFEQVTEQISYSRSAVLGALREGNTKEA